MYLFVVCAPWARSSFYFLETETNFPIALFRKLCYIFYVILLLSNLANRRIFNQKDRKSETDEYVTGRGVMHFGGRLTDR